MVELSANLGTDVGQIFAWHFMVNAFLAGTTVAVLAGGVGWFMVLRRQSFAGHTLAVVSFPGAAGAIWIGISPIFGYFAGAIVAALIIARVPGSSSRRALGEESALIGTVQAFALACGLVFVSLYGGFLSSLTGLLFGTFLGISDRQVVTLAAVAGAVLILVAVVARPLLFASVDPDVAGARQVPVQALAVLFLVLLGCTAAEVSQITGALLVFSLLVMPAAAAQELTARPAVSLGLTMVLAVVITWLALGVAFYSVYPVGFFVSTFGFGVYALAAGGGAIARRIGRHPRSGVTQRGGNLVCPP